MTARLWHLGRDLQSRLRDFFDHPLAADATPLELLHATLDQLEAKIQPAGRGRRIFPYDQILVRIAQPGGDPVAVQAIFSQLEPRLRERLDELRCEAPDTIAVSVSISKPGEDLDQPVLAIECAADAHERPAPSVIPGACPPVRITIVKGQCAQAEYSFEEPLIAIGRTAEPTDVFGQVRYNHVAFLEERDGINETVGRAHARLQFDPDSGHYHVFNDGSSNPTSIIRAGKMIRVAPRDPRGVRVQSGDQLQLGRAVLRLTIG